MISSWELPCHGVGMKTHPSLIARKKGGYNAVFCNITPKRGRGIYQRAVAHDLTTHFEVISPKTQSLGWFTAQNPLRCLQYQVKMQTPTPHC